MELLEIISLNWPAALCLIAGFVLVTVEMFTPGFGVPGISGLALLLIGVIVAADSLLEGILLTIIIVLVLCLLFTIAVRSASQGRAGAHAAHTQDRHRPRGRLHQRRGPQLLPRARGRRHHDAAARRPGGL